MKENGREGMRVLVTGGAGFIGSVLSHKLLQKEHQVVVYDKFLYGRTPREELKRLKRTYGDLEIVEADTRDIHELVSCVRRVDAIVHLAELVGDGLCDLYPQHALEINHLATVALGAACHQFRVPLVCASSCSVYGALVDPGDILTETDDLSPLSLYARLKARTEAALLALAGNVVTILRLGTVFGHSLRPRYDLVINRLTAQAVADKQFTLYGGDQWRPHVHVEDVADAITLALAGLVRRGEIFNVVGENRRIESIGWSIVAAVPGSEMDYQSSIDKRNYRVSGVKAKEMLGFEPQKTIRDGIAEVVEAIETGGLNWSDAHYHNVKLKKAGLL
jgi:nucleoside-diphosphate-sugar epimerase